MEEEEEGVKGKEKEMHEVIAWEVRSWNIITGPLKHSASTEYSALQVGWQVQEVVTM